MNALRAVLLAAVFTATAGAAPTPGLPTALCLPGETALFQCPIVGRHVAVCARGAVATYRFGRPERIELSLQRLHFARQGFSGGGEAQITATNGAYRYTVFDRLVRTGFGPDGLNHPREDAGLVVKHGDQIVSSRSCGRSALIAVDAERLLPSGAFVAH